jgi:outer membrane protein assembly factor BamB
MIVSAGDKAVSEDAGASSGARPRYVFDASALSVADAPAVESRAFLRVLEPEDIVALDSAEENFKRQDWDAGMKKMASLFTQKPEMLIPSGDGHTFTSVWEYFHNRMIHLPPSATERYRARTDSFAGDFQAAKAEMDIAALRAIVRDHLFTQPGRDALRFLAEHYYESRQYAEALACVSRFEEYLAFERSDSIRVAAMKLICLARSGRVDEMETASAALSARYAKEEVMWQGEKMSFEEFIQRVKGVARSAERHEDSGPLLPWHVGEIPLVPGNGAGYSGGEYPADEAMGAGDLPEWQAQAGFVDIYPVLRGETLYLRLRSSLYALDVKNPERPLWKASFPVKNGGAGITLGGGKEAMAAIFAAAAGQGRVFTNMKDEGGVLRLACLDEATGRQLWIAGKKDGRGVMDLAHAASAPACIGGAVYVTAVMPRGEQGDDYYLVCLNAADGRVVYETFLCTRMREPRGGVLYPPAPVTISNGTIYVATNAGAVCAVDMVTGRLRWAALYDSRNAMAESPAENRFERANRREVSFAYGAPVAGNGVVVAAPPEVDTLLAFDAGKGDLLWTLDNSRRTYAYLLGVRKGAVILSGAKVGAFDLKTGKPLWQAEGDVGAEIGGRGFLSGDFAVVPGADIVTVVDTRSGAIVSRTAVKDLLKPPAPDKISGFTGNLIPGGDKIYSVSRRRLAVFVAAKHGSG